MNPLDAANYINVVKQLCLKIYKFASSGDNYVGPFARQKKLFNKSYKKKVEVDREVEELLKNIKKPTPKTLFNLYKNIYDKYKALQ